VVVVVVVVVVAADRASHSQVVKTKMRFLTVWWCFL
jgi:hypothetical protein